MPFVLFGVVHGARVGLDRDGVWSLILDQILRRQQLCDVQQLPVVQVVAEDQKPRELLQGVDRRPLQTAQQLSGLQRRQPAAAQIALCASDVARFAGDRSQDNMAV